MYRVAVTIAPRFNVCFPCESGLVSSPSGFFCTLSRTEHLGIIGLGIFDRPVALSVTQPTALEETQEY